VNVTWEKNNSDRAPDRSELATRRKESEPSVAGAGEAAQIQRRPVAESAADSTDRRARPARCSSAPTPKIAPPRVRTP